MEEEGSSERGLGLPLLPLPLVANNYELEPAANIEMATFVHHHHNHHNFQEDQEDENQNTNHLMMMTFLPHPLPNNIPLNQHNHLLDHDHRSPWNNTQQVENLNPKGTTVNEEKCNTGNSNDESNSWYVEEFIINREGEVEGEKKAERAKILFSNKE
ncbi:hypothetical protein LguiB_023488 [Lonicera macranthoides]